MTKRELINTYLKSIGRTRVQGDSTEPLLPFLLGDAIYTIYNRDIAPLDLHREEKKLRNDWVQHYTLFNRPFFAAIGADNHDQVTDLMDDFEDAIANHVMVLRSELMLLLGDVPFDQRKPIVSALLCHVLAQAAQCAWGNVYRVATLVKKTGAVKQVMVHRPEKNRHLEAINRDAFILANAWHNSINLALVDPNKTKGIPPAINALCRKIYRWLEDN
jgi:hypothetical protein